MCRWHWAWLSCSVCLLGLQTAATAQGIAADRKGESTSLFGRLNPLRTVGLPFAKQDKAKSSEQSPKVDPAEAAAKKLEFTSQVMKLEREKLFRRQAICLKLLAIAEKNGDARLARLAKQLDQRAWEIYLERTGRLAENNTSRPGSDAPMNEAGKEAGK